MNRTLNIIAIFCIIITCVLFIFQKNNSAAKEPHEPEEKIVEQQGIAYYLDDRLGDLLLDYIDSIKTDVPSKNIIVIAFSHQRKIPFISFVSSYKYNPLLLRTGHFELNDYLILFKGEDHPFFDTFVKSENLEKDIPLRYLNEMSYDIYDIIGYLDLTNRIWIGEYGELIPE